MSGLANYNGWLGWVREARNKPFYAALRSGDLVVGDTCAGCGVTGVPLAAHGEEYGSTVPTYVLNCVTLCTTCHAVIHVRAKYPQVFARYKRRIADGAPIPRFANLNMAFQNIFRGNRPHKGQHTDFPSVQAGTWLDTLDPAPYDGPTKIATAFAGGVEIPDPGVYAAGSWSEMTGLIVDADGSRHGTFRMTVNGPIWEPST